MSQTFGMASSSQICISKIESIGILEYGEGPFWDEESQTFYCVDVFKKRVHKYVPSTDEHYSVQLDKQVTFIIPVEDSTDQFVVAKADRLLKVTWDGKSDKFTSEETLLHVVSDDPTYLHGINDGKCDESGRLWFGTIAWSTQFEAVVRGKGCLFSLEADGSLKKHLDGLDIANGLTWIDDKFYFIDSETKILDEFDFDIEASTIKNRKTIFTLKKHGLKLLLDGITFDEDGYLWIAITYGGKVIKVDPKQMEGLLQVLDMPPICTSLTFGGKRLDELYVTTGSFFHKGSNSTFDAGYVYKISGLHSKGVPMKRIKLPFIE